MAVDVRLTVPTVRVVHRHAEQNQGHASAPVPSTLGRYDAPHSGESQADIDGHVGIGAPVRLVLQRDVGGGRETSDVTPSVNRQQRVVGSFEGRSISRRNRCRTSDIRH